MSRLGKEKKKKQKKFKVKQAWRQPARKRHLPPARRWISSKFKTSLAVAGKPTPPAACRKPKYSNLFQLPATNKIPAGSRQPKASKKSGASQPNPPAPQSNPATLQSKPGAS
jgi:hypothetical protein